MIFLFDIDGTLLLSGGASSRALDRVLLDLHGIDDAMGSIRLGGKTDRAIIDEVFCARLGRPADDGEFDAVIAAYLPLLRRELAEGPGFRLMPAVHLALDYLAGHPEVLLAIATGNVRAAAEAKLARAGLLDRFVTGGYGCDHRERARLVARGIERARAERPGGDEPVVVVGDTPHDVEAARACGAQVVAVATGGFSRAELEKCAPDAVFDTLSELPAWHQAVASPGV